MQTSAMWCLLMCGVLLLAVPLGASDDAKSVQLDLITEAGDVQSVKEEARRWVEQSMKIMDPLLPYRDLQRGLVHFGSRERIRKAVLKLLRGEKFTIAAIGGSITAGQGVADGGYPWPTWMYKWIDEIKPGGNYVFHNGAVGGTRSSYMSMCLRVHVPEDVDIVFVEYAVNDLPHPTPAFNNTDRIAMELLIRKLLQLPNKPAVVMMNAYQWFSKGGNSNEVGAYWTNAEAEYLDFATYYGLSMVSVKTAAYHHMVAGKKGFKVDRPRLLTDMSDLPPRGEHFYWDAIHPDGNTGARMMGELSFMFITDAVHSLTRNLPGPVELTHLSEPLPRPILPGNYESTKDSCWIGPKFREQAIHAAQGFEWINEAPASPRPKWGYVATRVGASLQLKVSTRTNDNANQGVQVHVGVVFLKSYEHMGKGAVTCVSGCQCEGSELNGHHAEHHSQTYTHKFLVSQADECLIKVEVLQGTDSGEHKVKIVGVVVSENNDSGLASGEAMEYVHDIAFRGNGTFEVYNHA